MEKTPIPSRRTEGTYILFIHIDIVSGVSRFLLSYFVIYAGSENTYTVQQVLKK